MKEFVVYTGLRLLMFVATFGIIVGVWLLVADKANIFVAVVVAFIVSGVGSYFLLNRPREALAKRVEVRAERATKAFEERKAKEDVRSDARRAVQRLRLICRIRDSDWPSSFASSGTRRRHTTTPTTTIARMMRKVSMRRAYVALGLESNCDARA